MFTQLYFDKNATRIL